MAAKSSIEKQLKKPDSFQIFMARFLSFIQSHQKNFLYVLIPIAVVAAAGLVWQKMNGAKAEARRQELGKVLTIQAEELEAVGKKQEEIQKQIETLRGGPSKPGTPEEKKTPPAENLLKIAELEKQMTSLKPEHQKSLEGFKAYFDKYGTTVEGWMAGVSAAKLLLEDGKPAEAKPILATVIQKSVANKLYQQQARLMLVGILEDEGAWDEALKEMDVVLGLAPEELQPQLLLTKGRLFFFKNAKDDAKGVFSQILEKHGSSPEAQKARSIMGLM